MTTDGGCITWLHIEVGHTIEGNVPPVSSLLVFDLLVDLAKGSREGF